MITEKEIEGAEKSEQAIGHPVKKDENDKKEGKVKKVSVPIAYFPPFLDPGDVMF